MGLEKLINREIKITIGVVLFVSILFIALSYAIFKVDKSGASDVIKFGDISLSFCKDATCASNVSNIGNIIGTETDSNGNTVYSKIYPTADPVTNDDWNNLKPYIFTLTNTGSLPLYVSIFLERDMTAGVISDGTSEYSEFVSDDQVKIGFGVQGETPTIGLYSDYLNTTDNNHKIASNIQIGVGETKIFNLYAWLKSDAQNASLGKYFVTQISARGEYLPDGENTEVDENLKTIEIDFKEGTIDKNIKQVQKGNNVEFTLTPSDTSVTLDKLNITCLSGTVPTVSGNTLTISNVQKNEFCQVYSTPTLLSQLLADKTTRPGARTSFSSVLTTDNTKTLYTSTEDSKTVYYFAGNATDNWVKFGKNASNQDLYWRIIRTNSDGSVRLLYHGTSTTATDAYIAKIAFNSSYNNIAYVSYMYGSLGSIANARTNQTNSSTIKTTIDKWYKDNLNTNYGKYLSTIAVYCNDRSTSGNANFGARIRLDTNKTPSYDCAATEDKFTVDTSTGNGKLTYPIGLMTADEVSFAGGLLTTNAPTWYYYNSANGSSTGSSQWLLLSPSDWAGGDARVFCVFGSSGPGRLVSSVVVNAGGVRPALSLKSCVKYSSGDGSASAPYTIKQTTSGC